MKCDLSHQTVTSLDSVLIDTKRVSSFLLDWWILFTKVPACPLTGKYFTDEQLANIFMFSHCDLQPSLVDFHKGSSETAWTSHDLLYLRMSFWSFCLSQIMQETVSDNFSQDELMQTTRMVLHGSVSECPTQTLNDLVLVHKACSDVADPRYTLDVNNLKSLVHLTVRYLMTHSKAKTLEMLSQSTLPVLEPFQAHLLTTLLANSFNEEYLELLGF